MYGGRFQRKGLQFVRFWLLVFLSWFPFLPRSDAVYDAAIGNSISRSLKRYGLILLFRLIIVGFVVQGCGIDNIN
jgi:uncharacterized membrane protein